MSGFHCVDYSQNKPTCWGGGELAQLKLFIQWQNIHVQPLSNIQLEHHTVQHQKVIKKKNRTASVSCFDFL